MVRIFNLTGVCDAEEQAMRDALLKADISFYETSHSRWFPGSAALWVRDRACAERAKIVLREAQDKWLVEHRHSGPRVDASVRFTLRYWAFLLIALLLAGLTVFLPWWLLV